MFRLTREVRFGINPRPDDQLSRVTRPNGYAGFPALTDVGHYFALRVRLAGGVDSNGYLVNIKKVDAAVRERAVPIVESYVRSSERRGGPSGLIDALFDRIASGWETIGLDAVELSLSPFLTVACHASERPMTRLSQKFEFSATHRLHNPSLSEDENRRLYGKCNNPHGHGHNYEVQVTLAGTPGTSGLLMEIPDFERVVLDTVITRFDHKNLNVELPEFRELIPSVENIARVIHGLLKPRLQTGGVRLAGVTVWETPKTWCEYAE
jgi:6-pyruvoyltetrahydropterin/6-carboxytetrahydropterin synthase